MANEEFDELAEMQEEEGGFFEKGTGAKGLYFQIFDGGIVMKSKEVMDGFETVSYFNKKKKEDVISYVKRYEEIVARVVNVEKRKVKLDDGTKFINYNLTLLAGKKKAVLQVNYMDAFLRKFLKVAPNIDFSQLIRFSAFKKTVNGKEKQLISIKQGTGKPYKEWPAVPFYWEHEKHPNGEYDLDSPAVGADGSVLPRIVHDEESDEWDSREQNKFLVNYFNENCLPKIHEIAEKLGINTKDYEEVSASSGTEVMHTGPAIPVITSKPEEPAANGLADAMTPHQSSELRRLFKQIGADPDKLSNKFLETDFDDLSIEGAAYMKYRIEKKIAKAREEDPDAYPEPKSDESKLKAELLKRKEEEAKKKAAADEDDDDDWDDTPAKPKAKAVDPDDDDDDDDEDDWGK